MYRITSCRIPSALTTMLIATLLVLAGWSGAHSEEPERSEYELGPLGRVKGPLNLTVRQVSPDMTMLSATGDSTVAIFRKQHETGTLREALLEKTVEYGIPRYARPVDRELLKDLDVEEGAFVHGTVAVNDSAGNQQSKTRYVMVAGYRKDRALFMVEAWTLQVPDQVLALNGIQRSWRPGDGE